MSRTLFAIPIGISRRSQNDITRMDEHLTPRRGVPELCGVVARTTDVEGWSPHG